MLDGADVVAAPEVRLHRCRLFTVPDEEDVAEHDRNGAGLVIELWTVLDVKVQMGPQRVA